MNFWQKLKTSTINAFEASKGLRIMYVVLASLHVILGFIADIPACSAFANKIMDWICVIIAWPVAFLFLRVGDEFMRIWEEETLKKAFQRRLDFLKNIENDTNSKDPWDHQSEKK